MNFTVRVGKSLDNTEYDMGYIRYYADTNTLESAPTVSYTHSQDLSMGIPFFNCFFFLCFLFYLIY